MIKLKLNKFKQNKWSLLVHIAKKFRSETIFQNANVGDQGSIPGSGRSPGERNGYPLQYSCLENTMDRGAWWVIVHKVAHSHPMDKTEAT